ncbi:MAG: murein L,D-transpeptidase catalytic domain family protein [Alphaproteobacteria bacterium]
MFDLDRFVKAGIRKEAIEAALKAYTARRDEVKRPFLTLIDYALHSSKPRMFIIDMNKWEVTKSLLVAHGKGSDPDHDGYAQRFSNIPESKMSSVGAFITANSYYGKHGLAMRLIGLEKTNNAALRRAIVMHGANYVSPKRGVGRSWGCPSIEKRYVKEVIPKLAGGSFLYITH